MNIAHYLTDDNKHWWHLWTCDSLCSKVKYQKNSEKVSDKSEETRADILLAAFNEIYLRGFQAASLRNILKNTGATKGAIYHHFDHKLGLGYAVVDEVIRETIRTTWIDPLKHSDDPITVLQNTLLMTGKSMTTKDVSRGCPLNNLGQEMSPIDEGFKQRIGDIYQEWQETIEHALDRGILAGNVSRSIDSKEISLLFVVTLQGSLGFAKSVQNLDALMSCGQGLSDRIETLRPSKKSIGKQ